MSADWIRPIVHFEILARDPQAHRRFYGELFNWPFDDGPIMNGPSGLGGPEPGPVSDEWWIGPMRQVFAGRSVVLAGTMGSSERRHR